LAETEILKKGKINAIQRKMHKIIPKKQMKLLLPITALFLPPRQRVTSEKANPEHKQ